MAQVAQQSRLKERIDNYLRYTIQAWESLPVVGAEWDSWSTDDRLTFVIDREIPNDRLHQLHQWFQRGQLTLHQRSEYEQLLLLVEKHQALLEGLLTEERAAVGMEQ